MSIREFIHEWRDWGFRVAFNNWVLMTAYDIANLSSARYTYSETPHGANVAIKKPAKPKWARTIKATSKPDSFTEKEAEAALERLGRRGY